MFEQVKQEIDDKIKTNGNNEITATRLNSVLQDMMDASAEVIEEVQQSIGEQVEANPTGEATETLGKLKIGETIYTAPQGPQGKPGTDGQDGQPGAPGQNAYVHIMYSASQPTQDSDMHVVFNPSTDKYIGIYSGLSSTAPTTYNSYTWARFIGEDGQSGTIGEFKFEAYDADVADLTAIGDTTTEDINGLTASADTLTTIVLMPNNDSVSGTGTPTATMMIATQDDGIGGYEFVYIGDLQEAITPSYTFSYRFQSALISLLQNVVYTSGNSATLLSNLSDAMSSHGELVRINANYTQVKPIYAMIDTVEDMKDDLIVTAIYEDGYEEVIATGYELNGDTTTAGNKTITVTYQGETTTFQSIVQWKMSFSLGDGSLTMLDMSVQNNGSYGSHSAEVCYLYENPETTAPRKCFVMEKGRVGLKYATVTNATQSDMSDTQYFMIPIPATATKLTVAITPNSQYFGANLVTVQDGLYIKGVTFGGWQHGTHEQSLTAGQYSYICVQSKYDNAGATYPTPPSELTITFE